MEASYVRMTGQLLGTANGGGVKYVVLGRIGSVCLCVFCLTGGALREIYMLS